MADSEPGGDNKNIESRIREVVEESSDAGFCLLASDYCLLSSDP